MIIRCIFANTIKFLLDVNENDTVFNIKRKLVELLAIYYRRDVVGVSLLDDDGFEILDCLPVKIVMDCKVLNVISNLFTISQSDFEKIMGDDVTIFSNKTERIAIKKTKVEKDKEVRKVMKRVVETKKMEKDESEISEVVIKKEGIECKKESLIEKPKEYVKENITRITKEKAREEPLVKVVAGIKAQKIETAVTNKKEADKQLIQSKEKKNGYKELKKKKIREIIQFL
ncbi:hypothetical protein ECANGB1_1285 [Enterospora canceri]|uniref:Uncharacterized protein n=1 Tax=Enterospora canceri TaxID=1081671 RepID=A0A1Y1S6B7_9MICR|nr:hypothetical protein ECANGB1_1285 [Enterospora canceri]